MSLLTVVRDLFRYNGEFAVGVVLLLFVLAVAASSFFSPYPPMDVYVVPPDLPPSWEYILGTTSRGQDVFWQLTVAIRNTLLFGITVAILSRIISLFVGLDLRIQGRLGRQGPHVDQRYVRRHPALSDPRPVLLHHAGPDDLGPAGRHHRVRWAGPTMRG